MYWKLVKGIYFMIVLLFFVEHGTTRQRQEKMCQRCEGIWVYEGMNMDETYLPTETKSCCLQYLINLFNEILNKKVKNETFIIVNFVLSNPLVTQEKLWGGIDQNKSFHFKFQAMKRNFYHSFLTLCFLSFFLSTINIFLVQRKWRTSCNTSLALLFWVGALGASRWELESLSRLAAGMSLSRAEETGSHWRKCPQAGPPLGESPPSPLQWHCTRQAIRWAGAWPGIMLWVAFFWTLDKHTD